MSKIVNMKQSFKSKAYIMFGLVTVLILVFLEAMFGIISGTAGLIPLDFDPTLMLLAVMGILTIVVTTLIILPIKRAYM